MSLKQLAIQPIQMSPRATSAVNIESIDKEGDAVGRLDCSEGRAP